MPEMDPTAGGTDQRRAFPRIPLRVKVRMEFPEQRCFLSEWAVNLSPGGMFVRSEAPITPGQRFNFEADLTRRGPRFDGKAQVLWVRREWDGNSRPPGFAVRFLELEPSAAEAIQLLADAFLTEGQASMQQVLEGLAAEWQQRRIEEESTGEIPLPTQVEPLPKTEALAITWSPGAEEGTAEVPPAALDGDGATASTGDHGEVDGPPAGSAGAAEDSGATGPARAGSRRRPWWVGVLVLLALSAAFLAWRRERADALARRPAAPAAPASAPAAADAAPMVPASGAAGSHAASTAPAAMPARVVTPPREAGETAAALQKVTWESAGGDLWVVLALDRPLPAEAVRRYRAAQGPPREVIELLGVRAGQVRSVIAVHEALLEQVRVGFHPGDGADQLRVVLDLPSAAVGVRELRLEGGVVRVRLAGGDAPAAAARPGPDADEPATTAPTPSVSLDSVL